MHARAVTLSLALTVLLCGSALADPTPVAWDRAGVRVQATYLGAGELRLDVERGEQVAGPLVVSFPAGTWGQPLPGKAAAQELVLLRAPEVRLEAGARSASLVVPVACASHGVKAPQAGREYALDRFEAGSEIERLMAVLCAGPLPQAAEAQLAVWIVRNRLSKLNGRERTFASRQRVTVHEHVLGAVVHLKAAGLSPAGYPFFGSPAAPAAPELGATP